MRLNRRTALAAVLLLTPAAALVTGCSGDDTEPPAPGGDAGADADATVGPNDGASPESSTDAPTSDDADATSTSSSDAGDAADAPDTGPPVAHIRAAWFADPSFGKSAKPDAGANAPKYDLCIAPHESDQWQGPLLASAGGALSLYDVSKYFDVPLGQWDVRVIFRTADDTEEGGDVACDGVSATTDFTNLPMLGAGDRLTAVVTPSFDKSNPLNIAVIPLVDESSASSGKVAVRFANVSGNAHSDPLDFGLGGGVVFTPLFSAVSGTQVLGDVRRPLYGQAGAADGSAGGPVDAHGYVEIAPFTTIDMSLMDGQIDLGSSGSIDAPAGTVLSAFAVAGQLADSTDKFSVPIVCFDGQPSSTNPLLTKCTPPVFTDPGAPPPAEARFGNFIADPGFVPIDVCVKYHSQPAFLAPIGGRLPDGGLAELDLGQMTERYDIHAGFTYDVRVIAAGTTSCATPLAPDTTYAPAPSVASASIVFAGYVSPSDAGGAPFSSIVFPDLNCGESAPVVRVVNLDAPDPVAFTASYAGTPAWEIDDIPYGSSSSTTTLDACGYLGVGATTAAGALNVAGSSVAYSVGAQTEDTLFVYSAADHVFALDCQDANAGEQACTTLSLK